MTSPQNWKAPNAQLVLPVDPDVTEWLEVRRQGLGGTDAATIMGANKFATLYGTWVEKTSTEPPVDKASDLLWFGHEVEPMLARRFEAETGIATRRVGTLRSKSHPFMQANPDRFTGDGGGLEIKSTDWFTDAGKEWTGGEIPAHPWWQAQHCMAVSGRSHWWFAALVGRRFVIAGPVMRDEDAIAALVAAEEKFWTEHVQTGIEPAIDYASIDEAEARARFAVVDPAATVDILDQPIPEVWQDTLADFLSNRDAETAAKKAKDAAKARLMGLIGDREYLTVDQRPVLRWGQTAGARYFDQDAAVAELAELRGQTEFEVRSSLTKHRPDGRSLTVVANKTAKKVAA